MLTLEVTSLSCLGPNDCTCPGYYLTFDLDLYKAAYPALAQVIIPFQSITLHLTLTLHLTPIFTRPSATKLVAMTILFWGIVD